MKQNPQTNPKQNPHTNQRKHKQSHKKKNMIPTENPRAFMIQIQQKERNERIKRKKRVERDKPCCEKKRENKILGEEK